MSVLLAKLPSKLMRLKMLKIINWEALILKIRRVYAMINIEPNIALRIEFYM